MRKLFATALIALAALGAPVNAASLADYEPNRGLIGEQYDRVSDATIYQAFFYGDVDKGKARIPVVMLTAYVSGPDTQRPGRTRYALTFFYITGRVDPDLERSRHNLSYQIYAVAADDDEPRRYRGMGENNDRQLHGEFYCYFWSTYTLAPAAADILLSGAETTVLRIGAWDFQFTPHHLETARDLRYRVAASKAKALAAISR